MTTGATFLLQSATEFATSVQGRILAPPGPIDWLLVGVAWICVAAVFAACGKFFLWPGEVEAEHIKRRVLRDGPAWTSESPR